MREPYPILRSKQLHTRGAAIALLEACRRRFARMAGTVLVLGTAASAAHAGNPILKIEATGGSGGADVTAFVDLVEIVDANTSVVVGTVPNASFETPVQTNHSYNPTGGSWVFTANAGIMRNASSFNNPNVPDGVQGAFLQSYNGVSGSIQQTLPTLAAGTYKVRLQAAQRNCCAGTYDQGIRILVDGNLINTYVPANNGAFALYITTNTFVVDPPSLTTVAPTPGGLGQSITLSGLNLSNPTALTINGVAVAIGNIISNSGTSLVVRVPTTAATSGNVSITTNAGTATLPFSIMSPPGNALALDGIDDYVALPNALNTANFTFEAWVNYQDNGNWSRIFDFGTGIGNWMILGPKNGYGGPTNNNIHFSIKNAGSTVDQTILTNTPMPTGAWHHVAVTLATVGATTSGVLYLDGNVIGSNANLTISPASLGTLTQNWLGRSQYSQDPYLRGSLDEVRIYNAALTQANIRADMLGTASAVPANLRAYYNFDAGTPGGNNAGLNTLYDLTTTANHGTLYGPFALSNGNTTSNWVESYAMVVPTATAATTIAANSFSANWTAPAVGTVNNYLVDVSTSSTFASFVAGSPFTVASPALTTAITGLAPSTTYYYRVRADKNGIMVTGQGDNSNTVTVATPSNVSSLSGLTLGAGAISPAFASGTTAYTLTVPGTTTSTTVTPTTTQANATITVNGTAVASGSVSGAIALVPGSNTITVRVTAQDGTTTTNYTVTVTRTPCAVVAIAQNVTATLDAFGNTSVTAAQVNNGSTASCGFAAGGGLSISPNSFSCSDAVATPATNTALTFNGNQYVEGTSTLLPMGNAARTMEAWVYPTTSNSNGVIFNYGTPTNNQRAGMLLSNGKLYYVGEFNDLSGNIVLSINAWHHVAATYDGTTLRLYVDGVLDRTATPPAFNTTGTTWRMAQRSAPQTGEFLTGRLDEVRVWTRALTAAEVTASAGRTNPASLSGLVARWDMHEGSGSNVGDVTANNPAGTAYGTPTWTTPGVAYQGVMTALTVTDAFGNTGRALATVTVQDNTAPSTFLLPTAPALAAANVPEAAGYGVLYQLDVPNAANFNFQTAVPYTVNNSGVTLPANPTRVAYFMELANGSGTKWVWASMNNFAANLTQLGLPHPTVNNVTWHQNVSNLNVFASAGAGVTTGTNVGTGRIEMWRWDYGTENTDNVPNANPNTYDFSDRYTGADNYGSFQVHNIDAQQTIFAYNRWGNSGTTSSDIGIGNQVGGSGQPDWTFASTAASYTVKRIYIMVPNVAAPTASFTQPATLTLDANGTAAITAAQVYKGNVTDNCTNPVTVTITPATVNCSDVGTPKTVTVAVSDASGNTLTQTTTVTVQDKMAPIPVAQNINLVLNTAGTATPTAAALNNNSTDNCSPITLEIFGGGEKVLNGTFDFNANNWVPTNVDGNGGYRSTGGIPDGYYILNDNGRVGIDPTLTQTITGLTVGTTYLLRGNYTSIYSGGSVGTPAFAIDFNGTQVKTLPNPGVAWTYFTMKFVANSTSLTLALRGEIDNTDIDIAVDNISIRQINPVFTCANTGPIPNVVTLVVTDASGNYSTADAVATVSVPPTPTTTWNGSTSTDPMDCSNWSYGKLPDATTNAVIPASTNAPNLTAGTLAVANLTITTGTLTVAAGSTLQVNGNFTNNGTANLLGTVAFAGTSATQTLGGTSSLTFNDLAVNKASGTVQLTRNVLVNGNLTFTPSTNSGTLTTGAYKVVLGATATIAESNTTYVIGAVETTRNLNTAGAANTFGGLGLTLTPTGTSLPGSTLVLRVTGSPVTGVNSRQGIGRYFTLTPTTNANLNVAMGFDYFDHELNGIAATNLTMYRGASAAGTVWMRQAQSTRSGNTMSASSFTTLAGTFTLGSLAAPLPVELTNFTATLQGRTVNLSWRTASEKNSARFEVERSTNGRDFDQIGTLAGQGTKTAPTDYALPDAKLPTDAAILYYRLTQVDLDGTASYSPVRAVALATAKPQLLAYPNPAHDAVRVQLLGAATAAPLQVFDALGRLVLSQPAPAAGTEAVLPLVGLPTGVYVLRCGPLAQRLTLE